MKRKDYDDDLLVELIARGETPYAEIAKRVGIARQMVWLIARGQNRPDLQDQINTRMRTLMGEARSGGGRSPSPRKKDYDDDLLADLIARGDLTYTDIAERVGIGETTVARIALGRRRPDLQEKINTRMRMYMAEAHIRRRKARRDTPGEAPCVPSGRRKHYDDDLLVELLSKGNLSLRGIGERVGISATTVSRIARGETRRDLQPRIAAAVRGAWSQAFRMGATWMRGLLANHIKSGIEGDGDQARRCREFAMTFIAKHGHPGDAPVEDTEPVRGLSDLSPGLQKQILDELGVQYDDSWSVDQTAEGELENS